MSPKTFRKPRRNIEDGEQRSVIIWSKTIRLPEHELFEPDTTLFDYLFHIPNGGGRSKAEAGILKLLGVKAGVSDLLLSIPTSDYAGLYIEMKPPKKFSSKVTDGQKKWKDRMNRVGYLCVVAYGYEEAVQAIRDYMKEYIWITKRK